jgi:hypothetical protein
MARSGDEASIASPWLSSTAEVADVNTRLRGDQVHRLPSPHFHCRDAGMPDTSVVVYARACYRVVRIEGEDSPDCYLILDTAGAELRREPRIDDARAWVDARIPSAALECEAPPARRLRR